jgi:hypothetical protein
VPSELTRKLGYRGGPAVVVEAPPGYLWVEAAPPGDAPPAFVLAFVTSVDGLRKTVWPLLDQSAGDPLFWVAYPKQTSGVPTDLNRDVVARTVEAETAFRVVSNVAIDATWSALRLRPKALVRPRT